MAMTTRSSIRVNPSRVSGCLGSDVFMIWLPVGVWPGASFAVGARGHVHLPVGFMDFLVQFVRASKSACRHRHQPAFIEKNYFIREAHRREPVRDDEGVRPCTNPQAIQQPRLRL